MPDSNIVACVVCHDPAAESVREIPRLGGLEYPYLKRRLEQWGQGYNVAAGPPMPHIAGNLSPGDIEAIVRILVLSSEPAHKLRRFLDPAIGLRDHSAHSASRLIQAMSAA
jgi:cytochrome c553